MKTKKIAYILTPLSIAILVVFHTINIYAMKIDPASQKLNMISQAVYVELFADVVLL